MGLIGRFMLARKASTLKPLLSLILMGIPVVVTMKSIRFLLALIAAFIGVRIPFSNSLWSMFSVVLTEMKTTFSFGISLLNR